MLPAYQLANDCSQLSQVSRNPLQIGRSCFDFINLNPPINFDSALDQCSDYFGTDVEPLPYLAMPKDETTLVFYCSIVYKLGIQFAKLSYLILIIL